MFLPTENKVIISYHRCFMVSYDWANGGLVGAFLRHGMVSGLRGESVLFLGMGMEFEENCAGRL